jgi:hypothetical protein
MEKKRLQLLAVGSVLFILIIFLLIYFTNTDKPASPLASATEAGSELLLEGATFTPVVGTAVTLPTPSPQPSATPTPTIATTTPVVTDLPSPALAASATLPAPIPLDAIIVNHESVALFDQIPEEYLQAAANLHMLYIDESVGFNIDSALTCLSSATNEVAPHRCSVNDHIVPTFSSDPAEVSWNKPGGYDRRNWLFLTWPEGSGCKQWSHKTRCFLDMIDPLISQYDVVSYQFTYLDVAETSRIADQPGGYFSDNADIDDVFDQAAYEAQHPDKIFIYWTTSLARSIGTDVSQTFNSQMRQYAIDNGKPLFDVADILSHDPNGNPCYDDRDGIPYDNGNRSENYPDDGLEYLAICQHYTTEVNGGHLGTVSTGSIRVAKAFWVLMAYLAGWNGTPVP